MPFYGQHRVGGMGEPLEVSCDVGHLHVFPRQNAHSSAGGLLNESRWGRVPEESTHCIEREAFVCLSMGNIGQGAWVSPRG